MPNRVKAAIDGGTKLADNDVAVYFAADGEKIDFVTNEGDWNAYERRAALAALDTYAAVVDLNFTVVGSAAAADFKLTKTPSVDGGSLGFMNPPDPAYGDAQGVAWFNASAYWSGARGGLLDVGAYMYTIFLHEFGHGMGLKHPHEAPRMPDIGPGDGLDQGVYTVMTYNDGWPEAPEGLPPSRAWGWNLGPSPIDIAVLQDKYGANLDTATGDDRYVLQSANGKGTGYLGIWDAGGTDTIAHDGSAAATIDLRAATLRAEVGGGGWVSHVSGIHGGFTIANGVTIENAQGGSGADTITGNDARNALSGGGGNDVIDAGARADALDGGAGRDRLAGGSGQDALDGGAGNDTLVGGSGNDDLTGGGGTDTFVFAPRGGTDTVIDFRGRDVLDLTAFALASFAAVEDAISDAGDGWSLITLDRAAILLHGPVVAEDVLL